MNDKPEGWYYVGDGKLRYRDDYGWTDFYMDTTDPRAREWPPPTPEAALQQFGDEMQSVTATPKRRGLRWLRRGTEMSAP